MPVIYDLRHSAIKTKRNWGWSRAYPEQHEKPNERQAGCAVVQCGGKLGENPLGATSRLTLVNAQPAAAVPRQRRVRGGKSRPSLRGKVIIVKSSNSDSHGICFFDGLCKSVSASEPSFGRSGHTQRRLIDDDPGD